MPRYDPRTPDEFHCRCVIFRENHNPSYCVNPVPPGFTRCPGCESRHPDLDFPEGDRYWVLTQPLVTKEDNAD